VIAAQEFAHALQDAQSYPALRWRHRLLGLANAAQQLVNLLIIGIPILRLVTRMPVSGLLFLAVGLASFGSAAVVHLITPPVELVASFPRALTLLDAGHYIPADDLRTARQFRQAAALTYVAGSLAGILNLWLWISLLGRRS
jgi:Zn-dependent membrane protease YugP